MNSPFAFQIHDTASYARVYQTRAGFHTPIFILVTSRQRRVITHASNYLQTDGQLKLAAVFSARDKNKEQEVKEYAERRSTEIRI